MRPAGEILAELRRFGHFDACEQIAKDHGTALTQVADGDTRKHHVSEARHAIWRYLVDFYNGAYAPVAKIWGCHHTSLLYAECRREIMHVVLDGFEDPAGHGKFQLEYRHRAGGRFGVNDLVAGQTMWFPTYQLAREVFAECCKGVALPTAAGAS